MTLINLLAIIAFISLFLSFWKTKENGTGANWLKYSVTTLFGIAVLIITVVKNGQDRDTAFVTKLKADSVRILLDTISSTNRIIAGQINKIDTMQQYLKRLDSIGIKRNQNTNQPIITPKYFNRIDKVGTLTQY